MNANGDTELRKLPAGYLSFVEEALETNEDWKTFMSHIPKNLENLGSDHFESKYNGEDIKLVEDYANKTKVKCAKVLFGEWGTSGRVRPTLRTLLTLLVKEEMFKAADAIANMLGEPLPQRPHYGPAARVQLNVTSLLHTDSVTQQLQATASDRCNDPTKQIGRQSAEEYAASDMIKFSKTIDVNQQDQKLNEQVSPSNINLDPGQVSDQQAFASDMMKFSNNISDSQYLPASAILNPKTYGFQTDSSLASSSGSESLQSHSYASQSTPSQSFQSSKFYDQTDKEILEDANLIQFAFQDLEAITNNFTATLVGSGGFGDVFLGTHDALGLLAVKKIHEKLSIEIVTKMFNNEVKFLSLLHHKNIVPLVGYSLDGPSRCIVCEYIDGGSLKQKIADKVLNKTQRMNIMIGTAEGLRYIHNAVKPIPSSMPSSKNHYFLHGDVKSANILLTKDNVPKLCDFGLAKQFDTTYYTANIIGTQSYMAPESIFGTITQKSDVYSYGIVLLELLTGRQPIVNENNMFMNIKDYLYDNCEGCDIALFLDKVVDKWAEAQSIYGIAKLCLNTEKNKRPSMDEICKYYNEIHNNND